MGLSDPLHGIAGRVRVPLAILAVGALGLSACGGSTTPGSASTTTAPSGSGTTAPTTATQVVSLYWIRNGETLGVSHRTIAQTVRVGTAAVDSLLQGPDAAESAAGLGTAVPSGSKLLGLAIANGTATANFNSAFESGGGSFSTLARIGQVVFTLTQFPTVQRVEFEINGAVVTVFGSEGLVIDHPLSRTDELSLLPPIFVETPAVGDTVESPLQASGLANTFEATFQLQLLDAGGHVLLTQTVTATAGTGTWGTFQVSVPFTPPGAGPGVVRVFEISAKDGSHIHQVDIPITIR